MKFPITLFFAILPLSALAGDAYNFVDSSGKLRRLSRIEDQPPHLKRIQKDGGSWQLWYLHLSTRSEGLHGELRDKDGQSIQGEEIGQEMVVDGVVYVWNGEFKGRTQLFSASGWLEKDVDGYRPATKLAWKVAGTRAALVGRAVTRH